MVYPLLFSLLWAATVVAMQPTIFFTKSFDPNAFHGSLNMSYGGFTGAQPPLRTSTGNTSMLLNFMFVGTGYDISCVDLDLSLNSSLWLDVDGKDDIEEAFASYTNGSFTLHQSGLRWGLHNVMINFTREAKMVFEGVSIETGMETSASRLEDIQTVNHTVGGNPAWLAYRTDGATKWTSENETLIVFTSDLEDITPLVFNIPNGIAYFELHGVLGPNYGDSVIRWSPPLPERPDSVHMYNHAPIERRGTLFEGPLDPMVSYNVSVLPGQGNPNQYPNRIGTTHLVMYKFAKSKNTGSDGKNLARIVAPSVVGGLALLGLIIWVAMRRLRQRKPVDRNFTIEDEDKPAVKHSPDASQPNVATPRERDYNGFPHLTTQQEEMYPHTRMSVPPPPLMANVRTKLPAPQGEYTPQGEYMATYTYPIHSYIQHDVQQSSSASAMSLPQPNIEVVEQDGGNMFPQAIGVTGYSVKTVLPPYAVPSSGPSSGPTAGSPAPPSAYGGHMFPQATGATGYSVGALPPYASAAPPVATSDARSAPRSSAPPEPPSTAPSGSLVPWK